MKYKIWDKQERLYTPSGESFSAQEYISKRAGWAAIPGIKCVIADAPINCSVFMEFEQTKKMYQEMGAEITDGMTDQQVLDAISEFEERPVEAEASADERIAAALEFNNLLSM